MLYKIGNTVIKTEYIESVSIDYSKDFRIKSVIVRMRSGKEHIIGIFSKEEDAKRCQFDILSEM